MKFWLPLWASWLLMMLEGPVVNALIARMAEAKLQLAAFGVAFSLALAIESPIVSQLTVGNALARNRESFRLLRRFMWGLIVLVTAGMLLVTLTPAFDLVVVKLIGTPIAVATYVRSPLLALAIWPAAIAYRRFHQGVMIRYGYTRQVSYGTVVRLLTSAGVALAGYLWSRLDGATVAGLALAASALAEAILVHFLSRPAVNTVERMETVGEPVLSMDELLRFYSPLTLTSMIMLSTAPLINFGLARAPNPIESLATWPVVNSQLLIARSFGLSLQEVVVARLDGAQALKTLQRFAVILGVVALLSLVVLAFTPLALWWQMQIAGLNTELTAFAVSALRLAVLLPSLNVLQSWFRGILVTGKTTGAIAQATVINLAVLLVVLLLGAGHRWLPGASLAAIALTASQVIESVWLWRAARPTRLRMIRQLPSPDGVTAIRE
ncbi:MAG: hypothetical protein ACOYZ7_11615 [Chloroflexota bacterium]